MSLFFYSWSYHPVSAFDKESGAWVTITMLLRIEYFIITKNNAITACTFVFNRSSKIILHKCFLLLKWAQVFKRVLFGLGPLRQRPFSILYAWWLKCNFKRIWISCFSERVLIYLLWLLNNWHQSIPHFRHFIFCFECSAFVFGAWRYCVTSLNHLALKKLCLLLIMIVWNSL